MSTPLYPDIDIEYAVIPLVGEVNEAMYRKLLYGLGILMDAENITIYLNTEGGDFYQGLAMYDLIKAYGGVVNIVCNGPVMSAGTIILQAGAIRASLPHSQFMMHYGDDSSDTSQNLQHNARMLKLMKDILGERAKVTRRMLNSWFAKDTYLDAEQALSSGIIDKVITDGKA